MNGTGASPMGQIAPAAIDPRLNTAVPVAPMQPTNSSRPAAWPGGAESNASPWPAPDPSASAPIGEVKPCDGIRILARVGSEAILESEVIATVNEIIAANKDKIPADQIDKVREQQIQLRLKNLIELKLVYWDARRNIPAENWPEVEKQLNKEFDEHQLPRMMRNAGVKSPREFDQKLRLFGTSLERERRAFAERMLAQQWRSQQVKVEEGITPAEMIEYYQKHLDEYTTPAGVRWEELMVRFSKYPTRAAAQNAIAQMGNEVLAGRPFAEIAKKGSDGSTALDGGQWPWTSQGSLTNEQLDAALFSLPTGQMSRILASDKGYHIVRVIERRDKEITSFETAQTGMREKIRKEREDAKTRDYMAKLEARTFVWTIYDGTDGAQQLATPPSRTPTRR